MFDFTTSYQRNFWETLLQPGYSSTWYVLVFLNAVVHGNAGNNTQSQFSTRRDSGHFLNTTSNHEIIFVSLYIVFFVFCFFKKILHSMPLTLI